MPANKYYSKTGELLPGVTTIVNQLDKPQLLHWVARVTKGGGDWQEERDSAGKAGTLTHALIMSYWTKAYVVIAGYTFEEIGQAYFCYDKFLAWAEKDDLEIISIEEPIINEELACGGTPDIFAKVKSTGKLRRIDAKTSNNIYDTYWYQLGGYDEISERKADEHQVLWLPKGEGFAAPIRTELRKEKRIFRNLLKIYYDRRE